ncbi:MAG: 5-(carboxyamino)imidazole ribonucleotide synthase [Phycisphaerales bacterium]
MPEGPMVGILGGGQLGRMLADAATTLGVRTKVLDPDEHSSAGRVTKHILGDYSSPKALAALAEGCDVVTYEFENVPVEAAERIAQTVPVRPTPEALRVAQDRLNERKLFGELGIASPTSVAVDAEHRIEAALSRVGVPALLKARRLGYDGKGQFLISGAHDIADAWRAIAGAPAILDAFVGFEREVSVIGVRATSGECRFYPLAQNVHRGGILRVTTAPAPNVPEPLREQAESAARAIMEKLDYVGVLAVEFFQIGSDGDARLVANEIAPRVHNTGHWTIEGAPTSQFENHIRAVLGMDLGDTTPAKPSAMVNAIGELPEASRVAAVPGAVLHDYEKSPRPGRKVGHVTLTADTPKELHDRLERYTRVVG